MAKKVLTLKISDEAYADLELRASLFCDSNGYDYALSKYINYKLFGNIEGNVDNNDYIYHTDIKEKKI